MNQPVFYGKSGKSSQVKIPVRRYVNNGHPHFMVDHYLDGKRKQKSFADLEEAKAFANETAEAIAAGQVELCAFGDRKREIQNAIDLLDPLRVKLDAAARLVADALAIVPSQAEVLEALRHWKTHRPAGNFAPKIVSEAVRDYNSRRNDLSRSAGRAEESLLKVFVQDFGERELHTIAPIELCPGTKSSGLTECFTRYCIEWRTVD